MYLQRKHEKLANEHEKLKSRYEALKTEVCVLQVENQQLQQQYMMVKAARFSSWRKTLAITFLIASILYMYSISEPKSNKNLLYLP